MVNVKVVVRNINYDQTVVGVYPMLMEKCREMEYPHLPARFLLKMGNAARKIIRGILSRISEDTMSELLCSIVCKYNQEILKKLNLILSSYEIATVGGISASKGMEGQITLNIWNIHIHYKGFARSSTGRQMIRNFTKQHMGIFSGAAGSIIEASAKFASGFASKFEKFFVSQLEKENNKKKILGFLHQFLEKYHIRLELVEVSFGYGSIEFLEAQKSDQISLYDLEDEVLDKVVEYLKLLIE